MPTTTISPIAAQVRAALGRPNALVTEPGESDTRVSVWSVRELEDLFARFGGTVTASPAVRLLSDGTTFEVIEVATSFDLPDLGPVEVFTDWVPADEAYALHLPVIQAIA